MANCFQILLSIDVTTCGSGSGNTLNCVEAEEPAVVLEELA